MLVFLLLWPNGWMYQDDTWYGGRPQPRRLCVRWGPSPYPKRGVTPQFSAHIYCDQTAAWIKMPLGTELGLGLRDIVVDVDPAIPRKKDTPTPPTRRGPNSRERGTAAPLFSAHAYCGHGRPSHLLLSSCYKSPSRGVLWKRIVRMGHKAYRQIRLRGATFWLFRSNAVNFL